MGEYKYRIVREGKWRFELMPNNSNIMCMGKSGDYESEKEARDAIDRLRVYLTGNPNPQIFQETKMGAFDNTLYRKYFYFSEKERFSTKFYDARHKAQTGMKKVLLHYNADIREDLTTTIE